MRALAVLLLSLAVLALGVWWLRPTPEPADGVFSLQGLLGGEFGEYARAEAVRPFRFPDDHGPHPDFRSEWWYVTGNLRGSAGERYGFQFTVFRFAMAPRERDGASAWGTRQAYMAHLAVADIGAGRSYAYERFARGALDLAGAQAQPFAVWLEDWRLSQAGAEPFPWLLRAAEGEVGLSLRLAADKPPVLQGEQGLSRKGPEPGNASYYYSYTRMSAEGELTVGGRTVPVRGEAWLDREWSTSALSPDLEGWDWFSLQLEDGGELMLYQLRRTDGGASPFSAATYVPADGAPRSLSAGEFRLSALAHWRSPASGARYPIRWRVEVPALAADLVVSAGIPAQELNLSVRYWEGAVDVVGTLGGQSARGVGYMELTGYGGGESGRTPAGR